jgi:hypothetical protein
MFGVADHALLENYGVIWLLGSSDMARIWRAFARQSPDWIKRLFGENRERLGNIIDRRNELSIRWLKRLGFHFNETTDTRFLYFEMRRQNVLP